jgi:hypothetical protein
LKRHTDAGASAKPLLYIDIDIGDGLKDRITVYDENAAKQLALSFCRKHGFDEATQETLEGQLREKIARVVAA